jgi:hypothetical protein
VFYDYELTNRDLLPALKPLVEHFHAVGGDPALLEPVLGVAPEYLRAALDEMQQNESRSSLAYSSVSCSSATTVASRRASSSSGAISIP